ncbi:MAG: glucosamine-6-phosphate deaminase [Oscillospiraceae bacterium]|nr:glucosamine-6-phosphate deaminase [Oscillospiraceae bacterium]
MKKIICETYEEMSAVAAFTIAVQVQVKADSVIGFATGSTPLGTYKKLRELYASKFVSFSAITAFNLDEYYPIKRDNPQSYYYFMWENLFRHVDIKPPQINIPDGSAVDPEMECADYDAKLMAAGGTDLQILGIGNNGHIGFNEPNEKLELMTNLVKLAPDTIEANSRFFDNISDVPAQAITMGMGGIFNSKHILLLINGEGKAEITKKIFDGTVTATVPASLLNLHPNVTVIMDKQAAGLICD